MYFAGNKFTAINYYYLLLWAENVASHFAVREFARDDESRGIIRFPFDKFMEN